jgi:glycosyltransferase involved in cell wall biosynthesis
MNKRLNVLIVTSLFPNSYEPTRGIFSYQIAKELENLCDITVIAPIPWCPQSKFTQLFPKWYQVANIPTRENISGIKVYHPRYLVIPKIFGFTHGLSMYFPLQCLIRQIHNQKRIDVINARWVFPDGLSATLVGNQMRIPVIVSALGCDINLYTNFWLRKPQILYTIRRAGLISTVSTALKEKIIELGISPTKIRCIYNGVDTTMFFPKNQKECRQKLRLDEEEKIVLFIGGMYPVKGIEYLIQAFDHLRKNEQDDFRLILVGDGPQRKELEEEVKRLALGQKMTFVGSKLHEEISDWINAADLLCLPSIREGRPNVIIEALACGKPVVASKVGGIPELVNNTNGILVAPKKPIELAETIIQALNTRWFPERIADSIRNLSWRVCAEQFMLSYEALVKATKN